MSKFDLGLEVIEKLKTLAPWVKAYYIGGTARDYLSSNDCNDVDIATNLTRTRIIKIFPDYIPMNTGTNQITIVNYKDEKFDLDSVINEPIEEFVSKGDLTINCIAVDPVTGEVIDEEGGESDLKSHTLRFSKYVFNNIKAGREARSVFRPFKFMARWGWDFSVDTEEAISAFCVQYNFNRLAAGTLLKTIEAINKGPYKDKAWQKMENLGVMDLLKEFEKRKPDKFKIKGFSKKEKDIKTKEKIQQLEADIQAGIVSERTGYAKLKVLQKRLQESLSGSGILVLDVDDTIIKYPHAHDSEIDPKYAIIKTLQLMDKYIDKGYKISFLSAQKSTEHLIHLGHHWLKRKLNDEFEYLDNIFSDEDTFAVGDTNIMHMFAKPDNRNGKMSGWERKLTILRNLCDKYDKVVFIDDSDKNISKAREAGLANLKCIQVSEIVENQKLIEQILREKSSELEERMDSLKEIFDLFEEKGHEIYIEGGAARDHVRGLTEINDLDIVCDMDPVSIRNMFREMGLKSFKLRGRVSVVIWKDEHKYEIYGTDKGKLDAELENKDLTCNSLGWNPFTGEMKDPVGGVADIKAGILRYCDINKEMVRQGGGFGIGDRVMRLIRFVGTFGWDVEPETMLATREYFKINNGKFDSEFSQKYFDKNWKKLQNGKFTDEGIKFAKDVGATEAFKEFGVDLSDSTSHLFESIKRQSLRERTSKKELAAAREVAKKIIDDNDNSTVMFVGGAIRDKFLGKDSRDIDIVTDVDPKALNKLFAQEKKGYKWRNGRPVFIIDYNNYEFEVRCIQQNEFETDFNQRDITINAIGMDALTGEIYDPLNGLDDINNKVISFTKASMNSLDDPKDFSLRALRAIRFYATLPGQWSLDKATITRLKQYSELYDELLVSPEAFNYNWQKILDSDKKEQAIALIKDIGFSKYISKFTGQPLEESMHRRLRSKLREALKPGEMEVFSTSKDSDLYKYFFAKNLKFGGNAGNAYGAGTYTTLEAPDELDDLGYSEGARKTLYGNNVYKFKVKTDRIFFLDYLDYITVNGETSSPETFLQDQFRKFGISQPDEETMALMTGDASGKAAAAFYKYMATKFYQNENGTLNSPVNGFVYKGKKDGHTAVMWNPYSLVPVAIRQGDGAWETLKFDSPEYKEYIKSATKYSLEGPLNDESHGANIARIFDGNRTEEKQKVYDLLLKYGDIDNKVFVGFFSNIVIRDNKAIDATYKSNLPQVDGFHHLFRVMDDKALMMIRDMGYYLNKLDAGLKFGTTDSNKGNKYYEPGEAGSEYLIPKEITGCIAINNLIMANFKDVAKIPVNGPKILRLSSVGIEGILGMLDFDSLELSKSKPSWTIPAIKEKLMSKFENAEDLLLEKPEPKKAKTKKIKETLREENITNIKVDDLNDTSNEDNSGKKTSTDVNVRTTDTDTNIDTNEGTDISTDVGSSIDKAIDDNNDAADSEPIITLSNADGIKDNTTQNKLKDIIVEAEKEVKREVKREANTTINKFLRLIEYGIPQQTSTNVSKVEKAKILRTVMNGILAQNLDVTYIALTELTKEEQGWKWSKAESKPTTSGYTWHEVPKTYLDIDDSKVFDELANSNYKLEGLLTTLKNIPRATLEKIFPEFSSYNKTDLPKELAKKFSSVPLDFSKTKDTKHLVDETIKGSHPIYESLFKMAGLKLVKLNEKNVPTSADLTPGEIQFISKESTTSDTGYASNASMCNIYNIYAPKLNEIFLKLKRNKIIYFESNPDITSNDKIAYAGTSKNIYFDIIYFYKDSDGPAKKYKLRFRFSGTTKDVNNKGTLFENILFKQLYTGLKAKNKEGEEKSIQSIIESADDEYKNNNEFKISADKTSTDFQTIITGMLGLKGIIPDFGQEVRVYLAVNNSSAAAFSELDAALESNLNIKGKKSLEMAAKLKQYVDISNKSFAALLPEKSTGQILTENIMKKADVVVSVSCKRKGGTYHILYIPISIKLSEDNGNGGDFGQKTWIRLAKDNGIAITDLLKYSKLTEGTHLDLEQQIICLFRYLEDMSKKKNNVKFQNFLKAITYYYVGDLSCMYAYCKNVTPVLANTAEAEFKFKRPKFIESISKFETIKNDTRTADDTNCTYTANTETGSIPVKFSKSSGQSGTTLKLQAGVFAKLLIGTDKAGANKLFRQFHPEASF